jgi:hypothetical protein
VNPAFCTRGAGRTCGFEGQDPDAERGATQIEYPSIVPEEANPRESAGADRVVSTEATRAFMERAGSERKELRVLDGLHHEVLNELDREEHIEKLGERFLQWADMGASGRRSTIRGAGAEGLTEDRRSG